MILFSGANIRTLADKVFWGLSYFVCIDFQMKFFSRVFRTIFFTIYTKKALSAGNTVYTHGLGTFLRYLLLEVFTYDAC